MKIHNLALILSGILWNTPLVHGQADFQRLLRSVEQNNPVLKAQRSQQQARQLEARTGLNPSDPLVEYDRLPGRPEGAGVQQDISITQQLDFPTVYARKRDLARQQVLQAEQQTRIVRQQILLDAQKAYIELVYNTKRTELLQQRLNRARDLVTDVSEKLRIGGATALQLDKARIQRLKIEKELRLARSRQQQEYLRLVGLNGGEAVALADTTYPTLPALVPLPRLDSLHEEADPTLAYLRQEIRISQAQLEVSRALTLPRLQIGYHYQSILGQRYQGPHLGVSLPLWEYRHTVSHRQAVIEVGKSRLEADRSEHYAALARVHEAYRGHLASLAEYRQVLGNLNTAQLLDTSLRLGQITTIEFILESIYLYDAQDTYLELEKETYLAAYELLRYQL